MADLNRGRKVALLEDDVTVVHGGAGVLQNGGAQGKQSPAISSQPASKAQGSSQGDDSDHMQDGQKKLLRSPSGLPVEHLAKTPPQLCRYYCKYCGKLFNKNCDLARHKRIHTGERPYKCDLCAMAFARKDVMHLHVRKHHVVDMTGGEKYTCLKCQASFTETAELEKHMLSHKEERESMKNGASDHSGTGRSDTGQKQRKKGHAKNKDTGPCNSRSSSSGVPLGDCAHPKPTQSTPIKKETGKLHVVTSQSELSPSSSQERQTVKSSSSHENHDVSKCKHCHKDFHKYNAFLRHQCCAQNKESKPKSSSKSSMSHSATDVDDNADIVTAERPEQQAQSDSSSSRGVVRPGAKADHETECSSAHSEELNSVDWPSVSSPSIDWYAHSPSFPNGHRILPQGHGLLPSRPLPCDCNFCRSCEPNPYIIHGPVNQHLCSPRTPDLCSPVGNRFNHMHAGSFCNRSDFVNSRLGHVYESNCGMIKSPLVSPCASFDTVHMHPSLAENCVNSSPCHSGPLHCSNEVCFHGPLAKYQKFEVVPSPAKYTIVQNPICANVPSILSRRAVHGDVILGREGVCLNRGCGCMAQIPIKQEVVDESDVSPHAGRFGVGSAKPNVVSPMIVIKEEHPGSNESWHRISAENNWIHQAKKNSHPYLGLPSETNTGTRSDEMNYGRNVAGGRTGTGDIYRHVPDRDHENNSCSSLSPQEGQFSPNNPPPSSARRSAFSAYHRDKPADTFPRMDDLPNDHRVPPTTSVRGVQPLGKLFSSGENMAQSPGVCGKSYQNTAPRYDLSPEEMDEFVASSITTVVKDNNQKVYQCNICKKCLSQKGDLKRHLKIHLGQKDFICLFCSRGFIKNSDLQRHIRTRHTREKPYECSQCLRKYARTDQLLDHVRMHLGDKRFECEICHEKFLRRYELQKHVREHYHSKKQGDTKFKTEPPEIVDEDDDIELDVVKIEMDYSSDDDGMADIEVEEESVAMETSDKESGRTATPDAVSITDDSNIVESQSCQSSPSSGNNETIPCVTSNRHSVSYPVFNPDSGYSFPSPTCDTPIETSSASKPDYSDEPLVIDIGDNSESSDPPASPAKTESPPVSESEISPKLSSPLPADQTCPLDTNDNPIQLSSADNIGNQFATSISTNPFKSALETQISPEELGLETKPICTTNTDALAAKETTEVKVKETTVKQRNTASKAKKPRRSKSGQNICQTCSRTFSQRGDLKRHMKIHTGQRDFVCSYCPKAFIKRSDLKRHLLVHTHEKPYSCEYCDMRFSRKDQLQTHINRRCSKRTQPDKKSCQNVVQLPTKPSTESPDDVLKRSPDSGRKDGMGSTASSHVQSMDELPLDVAMDDISDNQVSIETTEMSNKLCTEGKPLVDQNKTFEYPCCEETAGSPVDSLKGSADKCPDTADSKAVQSAKSPNGSGETKTRDLHLLPCKYCEKRFLTKTKLQIHLMTHTNTDDDSVPETMYPCSECTLSFPEKDLLDNHVVVAHRVFKPYVCGYCSKTFVNGAELEVHISEHRFGVSI